MPQGTIRSKADRSVATLKANPCDVTQRAMRTPIAPILSRPTQVPVRPSTRAGLDAVVGAGADHDLLEVAHVAVYVAPVRGEVDDGVAHHLPGAVVGHVAPASRFEDVEAALAQRLRREEHVLLPRVAAQGEDRVVLEQEQVIEGPARLPLGHERLLDFEPASVPDPPQPPDDEGPRCGRTGG